MKTFFYWLLVAVCLFTVGNAHVMASGEEKKKEDVKIDVPLITGKPFDGSDVRGNIGLPFTAYYQTGTIYVSSSAEFSAITINVENETTGQIWSSASDISDGMGEISISNGDAGNYTIEIATEYGERFVGSFTL